MAVKYSLHKKRIYLAATACALILLALFAAVLHRNTDERRSEEYLQKARESYVSGDYEGALLYLRRIEGKADDTEVLLLMADCYEAMGNYPRALETLRKLNTSEPAVKDRIQSIEQRRAEQNQEQKVTVAGVEMAKDSRSAVLNNMGIGNEELMEVAELYALDMLSLRNNNISDIECLRGLGGLDELDLSYNHIQDVSALSELRDLRILHLDGNPITACDSIAGLTGLKVLSLTDTRINEADLKHLAEALPSCAIRCVVDDTEQMLFQNSSFPLDSEELLLSGRGITDISSLGEFAELKVLDVSNNQITDISPLMKLSGLERLNISGNEIADLRPLIGLPLLWNLDAAGNQITETTSVGSLQYLQELNLSGNSIKDFSGLGRLEKLFTMDLSNTGITDMSLSFLYPLRSLNYLNLQNNAGLSNRAVGTLQSMLTGCSIATSDLVYEVEFSGRTMRSDESKLLMPSSAVLDLNGLERLPQLNTIDLSGNMIESLYQFEITPSRTVLLSLNLADNRITDISSLSGLTVIEDLDLSGNRIENIASLQKLTTLKRLNLSGNPVSLEAITQLKEALAECVITY